MPTKAQLGPWEQTAALAPASVTIQDTGGREEAAASFH